MFNVFDGDGRWVHTDHKEDPAIARFCASAFGSLWGRSTPHEQFSL
ncbi:DUF6879 family protein [Streptomyces katsurahamanus]